MKLHALFGCQFVAALALAGAGGCGPKQQAGTLSNPSAKAMASELSEAVDAYDSALAALSSAPGEAGTGEDPASILGGMRTRLNLLQQLTPARNDIQELIKGLSVSLDSLDAYSRARPPDMARIRLELEKLREHVLNLREKL